MRFLGICGSLRQASFNLMLLKAARDLAPEGDAFDIFDGLREIPPYDDDVYAGGFPDSVARLRAAIAAADAVVIASPEYNYSVPGVLKNALDWVSRQPDPPFAGKPVGLMGASRGMIGTARAQYHLRQVFVFLQGEVLLRPEIFVSFAHEKFGDDGSLRDATTRDLLAQMLERLGRQTA